MDNMDQYVTVTQYAKTHDISTARIYRKIQYGSIEAKKIDGKIYIHKDTKFTDNRVKSGKYISSKNKEITLNLQVINNNIIIENNDKYNIKIEDLNTNKEEYLPLKEYVITIKIK